MICNFIFFIFNIFIFIQQIQKACERYRSLSKEEKEKKRQYGHKRYKSLPKDEKQRWKIIKQILKVYIKIDKEIIDFFSKGWFKWKK